MESNVIQLPVTPVSVLRLLHPTTISSTSPCWITNLLAPFAASMSRSILGSESGTNWPRSSGSTFVAACKTTPGSSAIKLTAPSWPRSMARILPPNWPIPGLRFAKSSAVLGHASGSSSEPLRTLGEV